MMIETDCVEEMILRVLSGLQVLPEFCFIEVW